MKTLITDAVQAIIMASAGVSSRASSGGRERFGFDERRGARDLDMEAGDSLHDKVFAQP
jgi:hypothetical protein